MKYKNICNLGFECRRSGRLEHYDIWNYSSNNFIDINIKVFHKKDSYEKARSIHGENT